MAHIGTALRISETVTKAVNSSAEFSQFNQQETNKIVEAVYRAAFDKRVLLAKNEVNETKIGNWQDKVILNAIATQMLYSELYEKKSVGIVYENNEDGIIKIAHSIGPVIALAPINRVVSTSVFEILLCLKTRNPIIIVPPHGGIESTKLLFKVCYEAAIEAGAPEDCIQVFYDSSSEEFEFLLKNEKIAAVIGGSHDVSNKVRTTSAAAVIGFGICNVPSYVEKTTDVVFAAKELVASKLFDGGTLSSSEQAVVVDEIVSVKFIEELKKLKVHFLTESENLLLQQYIIKNITTTSKWENAVFFNTKVYEIAKNAGFQIPEDSTLLISNKGTSQFCKEVYTVYAPILSLYVAKDFDQALNTCLDINIFNCTGHAASIYSEDKEKIIMFSSLMHPGRIFVNTPTSLGTLGGFYNKQLTSFVFGCGSKSKNNGCDYLTIDNLLKIQTVYMRRARYSDNEFLHKYFYDETVDSYQIDKIYNRNY